MLDVLHLCHAPGVHPPSDLLVVHLNDRVAAHYCKRDRLLKTKERGGASSFKLTLCHPEALQQAMNNVTATMKKRNDNSGPAPGPGPRLYSVLAPGPRLYSVLAPGPKATLSTSPWPHAGLHLVLAPRPRATLSPWPQATLNTSPWAQVGHNRQHRLVTYSQLLVGCCLLCVSLAVWEAIDLDPVLLNLLQDLVLRACVCVCVCACVWYVEENRETR